MGSPTGRSSTGRLAVVAVALLVVLAAGVAVADDHEGELNAAYGMDEEVEELTFEFTANSDAAVSVPEELTDRDVTFTFAEWSGGGNDGEDPSWTVQDGTTYEVTYEARAPRDAPEDTYSRQIDVTNEDDGGTMAQETIYVDVLHPSFGFVPDQDVELAFDSPDGGSAEFDVSIQNDGQGVMVTEDVRFEGVPGGLTVVGDVDSEIDPGSSGTATIQVQADDSVDEGFYYFDAVVEDNLGNTQRFEVEVEVIKPANLEVDDVDVGDVLVGETTDVEFTLAEANGFESIDGISADVRTSVQYADISFDGLTYANVPAGGTETATVEVTVDDDASQHANLHWRVDLQPDDDEALGETIDVSGRVIYPAYYGTLSMPDPTMTFDEPKSSTTTHTEQVEVTVPNDGDLDMEIEDVDVTVDGADVDGELVDSTPVVVPGLSEETVAIELEADADAPEGTYPMTVTFHAAEAGTESVDATLEIEHGIEIAVDDATLEFGDVTVTSRETRSTDVGEVLEYRDVTDVTVEQVSGPDQWLTVEREPSSTISAGSSAPFVVAVEFDTQATLYEEYEWVFEVSGDDVEPREITVTATPKPYSFDQIKDPLADHTDGSDWRADTSSGMVDVLDTLETKLKDGEDVERTDLTLSMAAGRSALLFIDSVESAEETIERENRSAAQPDVLRAAAAYNTMELYASQIDDPDLQSAAEPSLRAADETVSTLVDEQVAYYEAELDDEDATVLAEARIKRQLAEIAALRGEEERAERLAAESADAFDHYGDLVSTGTDHHHRAVETREETIGPTLSVFGGGDRTMIVLFGQPLAPNPAKWDEFSTRLETIDEEYAAAVDAFEQAGAVEEAERVDAEREATLDRLQVARYSLYGFTAGYGVAFVGLIAHLARSTYAYVRDTREAVAGDFLLKGV